MSKRPRSAARPIDEPAANDSVPPPRRTRAEATNRRASPEAVEKRRAARSFNDLVLSGGHASGKLDGRTEKRRRRMLEELRDGTHRSTKRPLKPIEILLRAQSLLALGEPLANLRKACRAPRAVPTSDEIVEGVKRLHEAYGFPPELYALVGIAPEAIDRAHGVGPTVANTHAPGRAERAVGRSSGARSGAKSRRSAA